MKQPKLKIGDKENKILEINKRIKYFKAKLYGGIGMTIGKPDSESKYYQGEIAKLNYLKKQLINYEPTN